MSVIDEIAQAVEAGRSKIMEGLVTEALNAGTDPVTILNEGMNKAMGRIGEKFQKGEVFVSEMLMAARAMKAGVAVLKPHLAGKANASLGKCIIGTVHGDLHDIGKNLVAMMIESCGFEVIDLGVDVSIEKYISAIKENSGVKLVALSCLLTTTMPAMQETVAAIKASGLTGFKVMVGGTPITQAFADVVGADGYSPDAGSAAQLAKKLAA
ncbi:MAG: corrinoid protein [Treponema sp.]|nr:corrinoid protein [Treponema sp.]